MSICKTSVCKAALSLVLSLVIIGGASFYEIPAQSANNWEQLASDPVLRFGVLSDTHVEDSTSSPNNARFVHALESFYQLDPNLDAVAIAGDLTNYASEKQYENFNHIISANLKKETALVTAMGNHEFFS